MAVVHLFSIGSSINRSTRSTAQAQQGFPQTLSVRYFFGQRLRDVCASLFSLNEKQEEGGR